MAYLELKRVYQIDSCNQGKTSSGAMPQGSSGEWHTGEVVNLCKSYGFIRISKDGKSEDIFFYYGDVKGREPQLGDHVSFELAADAKCRDGKKAVAVEYSRRPRLETRPQTDEATAAGGAAADAPTTPTLVMGDDGTMYTLPHNRTSPTVWKSTDAMIQHERAVKF